ncbi:TPA: hypothetical protein ACP32N_005116 [Pseudomonas aeruginosa]
MKTQRSTVQPPQMALDFSFKLPGPVSVNSTAAKVAPIDDDQLPCAPKRSAAAELAEMVVDDRVLSQGITTWRKLIDFAIRTGHTELYDSEDGRQGLRRPGFRYAPIARLPERAPEYVKEVLSGQLAARLEKQNAQFATGRLTADESYKIQVTMEGSTFQISVFEGRKLNATWSFKLLDLPRTAGLQEADEDAQVAFISRKVKRLQREGRISGGVPSLIGQAVIRGVNSVLAETAK